jgi:hypothetical protein
MISVVSPEQALSSISRSLFLHPEGHAQVPTDAILAQALRRGVFILGPCASYELARAVTQSFAGFGVEPGELAERVDSILDGLIVYGDILEMRNVNDDAWAQNHDIVLRAAPPSFVARKSGSIVILGVAGDQITPLTENMELRVVHRGVLRLVFPQDGEDLQTYLRELGLFKLPERIWLRLPKIETAAAHVETWKKQISKERIAPSAIEGLRILDTARPPTFYRDRWCEPSRKHEGMFIARRPQRYGLDLWCLVELHQGVPTRFLDLNAAGDHLRACDVAWRIQAAIDALAGNPQQYRRAPSGASDTALRFFSPLPSWAERHLSVAGVKTKAERSLFAYDVGNGELDGESKLLREALWMAESSD